MSKDKHYLQNPDSWSTWPVVPLKRRKPGAIVGWQCGVMVDERKPSGQCQVIEVNMFALENGALGPQLKGKPTFDYESVDALLADGWIVD